MSSGLYDAARALFLAAGINWSSDTIKVTLIHSATYVVNLATHDFFDDVTGGGIATSSALGGKTTTAGVADANDFTYTAVSGATGEALVVWSDTAGISSTDPLIAYIDTGTGLPVTPNGGDITVAWDSGANKIFKL